MSKEESSKDVQTQEEQEQEVDHFPDRGDATKLLVKADEAEIGFFGLDRVHAKGKTMRMREWKDVPVGFSFAPHDYKADICGFVTKGKAVWTLDGKEFLFEKGDSYYLPAGVMYSVKEVIEVFEAVEVTTEGGNN